MKNTKKVPAANNAYGLKIAPPQPPAVGAYGADYGKYLVHYRMYVKEVTEIRENLKEKKEKPKLPDQPVYTSKSGVKYTIDSRQTWTAPMPEKFMGKDSVEPIFTQEYDIKGLSFKRKLNVAVDPKLPEYKVTTPTEPNKTAKKGPTEPAEAKSSRSKRSKKNNEREMKRELKAVKLAADLATTLSKADKVAARTGRKVVKTADGWNLIVTSKGGRKVDWKDSVEKQFLKDREATISKFCGAVEGFGNVPRNQFTAGMIVDALEKKKLGEMFVTL